MQVTLGGDRLGSGNKNKIALKNYERSTHNLSQKFTSSMQVGALYPFLVIPAMRGDKFTINLDADARTIPTKGPLFGSFKMQMDVFQCDVRLYQALLHNNPLHIGLNMSQVKFPKLIVKDGIGTAFSNTSLLKYLGMSGIGHNQGRYSTMSREINAIPALAYYEIFKTYYANKQEEAAYIIGTQKYNGSVSGIEYVLNNNIETIDGTLTDQNATTEKLTILNKQEPVYLHIDISDIPHHSKEWQKKIWINHYNEDDEYMGGQNLYYGQENGVIEQINQSDFKYSLENEFKYLNPIKYISVSYANWEGPTYTEETRGLEEFSLANIDDMRLALLSHHTLGTPFKIGEEDTGANWNENSGTSEDGLPYIKLVQLEADGQGNYTTYNAQPMNGLVVKTYQSDLFNNWVNTEWIDGENGIAAVTAISTADGSVKIDTINLAEKLYNMLNRVAVSDGSYEGWQDAVYTETPKRHIESPVYLGGMSNEVVFEEIVQTSQGDANNPLGTLGGKGKLLKRKGGHITVKCNEACFIIGIVSLTPRVNYCQGNEFYMTELDSMDDYHKPALDGIGFQNLIGERLAWWDTEITGSNVSNRHTIGKVPAWIEYMTAVDKCYGDFAETEGKGFMTLLRNYTRYGNFISDATTYIDPRKYNYAFALTDIDAQNFWVQIYSEITARRLMSAKQIPNI